MKKFALILSILVFSFSFVSGEEETSDESVYCGAIGTDSEGWYNDEGLIDYGECDGCTAYCDAIGTRSEGWYDSCTEELITYDFCGSESLETTLTGEEESEGEEEEMEDAVFPDIKGHEYEVAITYVFEMGIVNGYPDGTYKPDQYINRAEFTKIIIGAIFGSDLAGENCFSDVTNDWFAPFVCTAKENEVVNGYPDGTFKAGNNVNYVEALKIVLFAYGAEVGEPVEGDQWFQPFLDYALMNGLSFADSKTPSDLISRAEMAELIYWMRNVDSFLCDDINCTIDSLEICDDGYDNDENELIDCDDPGCANDLWCMPMEHCHDGIDNDADDLIDCDDSDCEFSPFCIQ